MYNMVINTKFKNMKKQFIEDISHLLIMVIYIFTYIFLFTFTIIFSITISLIFLLLVCFIFIITGNDMLIYMIDDNFNILLLISSIIGLFSFGEIYFTNKRWLRSLKTDLML